MNTLRIDKDFELDGIEYWYAAEVAYEYIFLRATYDSPEEYDFDVLYVSIDDVTIYPVVGEERELNTLTMSKELIEAIEEDAAEEAERECCTI